MTERFSVITGLFCAAYCFFTFGYPDKKNRKKSLVLLSHLFFYL